jgi:hypothetical protein
MVLLRRSVGAVGVGSVPGGAAGGARLSVLRLCEGRVPSRDYVGRDKVPVARERGVGVGKRLVGRRRAGRRRAGRRGAGRRRLGVGVEWTRSHHRGLSRAMALQVTKSVGRLLCFSAFLSVRPKLISGHPIGWVRHPTSESLSRARLMGMCVTWPAHRRTRLWK